MVEQVRRLGVGEVVGIVNTHQHFDHTFGNVTFLRGVRRAAGLRARGRGRRPRDQRAGPAGAGRGYAEDPQTEEDRDPVTRQRHRDIVATRIALPTETFSSARVVDLGDRIVELVHPGRGHTGRRRGGAGRRRGRDVRRRPGRGVRAPQRRAGLRRRLLPDGVAGHPGPDDRAALPRRRGRARARAAGRRDFVRGAALRRSAWSRRRSATSRPAACRSPRRSTPPSGPTRARSSSTRSPAATPSCRGVAAAAARLSRSAAAAGSWTCQPATSRVRPGAAPSAAATGRRNERPIHQNSAEQHPERPGVPGEHRDPDEDQQHRQQRRVEAAAPAAGGRVADPCAARATDARAARAGRRTAAPAPSACAPTRPARPARRTRPW